MKGIKWLNVLVLLTLAACQTLVPDDISSQAKEASAALLTGVPVSGELAGGGSFEGRLTINKLAYDGAQVVAEGEVEGTAERFGQTRAEITPQAFTVEGAITNAGSKGCDGLQLGLNTIYLSQAHTSVRITSFSLEAQAGPEKQLGNLLCRLESSVGAGKGSTTSALIERISDVLSGRNKGKSSPDPSRFFSTVSVEERSTYNTASDGDLWPSAWSDDGYLYTVNGDGKGFDLNAPWSDIVVNRLSGEPSSGDLTGIRIASGDEVGQVWGDAEKYNRKPTGMVSVDGVLYLAVQDLNKESGPNIFNDAPAATILRSEDKGKTWTWNREAPMFSDYAFTTIMFLDYGQDGENNTFDDYVYAYGLDYNWRDSFADTVPDPTNLYLARMPKDGIQNRNTWQFYTGSLDGKARWSRPGDIAARRPVLRDERRVYSETLFPLQPSNMTVLSQGSVVYNKPLNRYIYTSWTEYTFEFYEAPTPWGPWKRFLSKDFGVYPWFPEHQGGYTTVIPSKFISDDGREMWLNSNTFVGGIQNYNLSLRRLNVTPYVPTKPTNMPNASNLALPSVAENVTPISRSSVHFGNVGIVNDGSRSGSEDSWNGEAKPEDWWGYTWPRTYNMNQLVYTTGRMFGNDGGWFENVRVQVRRNFVWRDVEDLSVTPDYAGNGSVGSNVPYIFSFRDTWGDGIRVIGVPGGIGRFTSMAELEVYYTNEGNVR